MEDTPEIMKLLKYILFVVLLSHVMMSDLSHALVTESPAVVPVPFYHSEEVRSDLISSFNGNREGFRKRPEVQRIQDDLDPDARTRERTSGGHKEIRQVPPGSSDLHRPAHPSERRMSPPPHSHRSFNDHQSNSLGSLCSIFRTFLEPRRFPRCHVSNGEPSGPNYFDRDGPTGSASGPLHSNDLNHELQHHRKTIEDMHREGRKNTGGPPSHDIGGPIPSMPSQSIADKRYDHIEDIHINHSGEEDEDDHLIHSGLTSQQQHQQDPTKISQDRTMIVVPERSCPPGQRRDPRGYCRRLVKIRTNYQYGPPPGVVRPIPIRYYYSRIVAIPTLHFFFQNV